MRAPIVLAIASHVLFTVGAAHADLVPNGQKSVKLSIRVDGELPADKALVLARTFRGADVLSTGKVLPVEWHPMGGAMGLVMLDAASAAKIEEARKTMNRDAIKKITDAGVPCSAPIEGVRTVPDTSPTAEVRWTLAVQVTGASCVGKLVRTEFLSKDATVVETKEASSAQPATPPSPSAAPPSPSAAPSSTAPKSGGGGCAFGCAVGAPSGATGGAFALFLGALAFARRRRARSVR